MVQESIINLLFDHNCVILPGFGGFITNRLHSRINEMQHRVEPPRKVVAFNKNLVQNDGLLAEHISRIYFMSYNDAMDRIAHFVSELEHELNLKKHAVIKSVGDFYLNSEGSLVFIPEADVNFAKDTFGLFPIPIRKITREITEERNNEERNKTIKAERGRRKLNRKLVYGTVLVALPLVLGFFTQQSGLLQNAGFNINAIFPREQRNAVRTADQPPTQIPAPPVIEQTLPVIGNPVSRPDTVQATTPQPEKAPEVAVQTTQDQSWHYHIIGGSFAYPENADKFLAELKSKGYHAYIAGKSATGLVMVSFAGYTSEQEALTNLVSIRSRENAEAWLLNN
jgi:cell division septation protein DedD